VSVPHIYFSETSTQTELVFSVRVTTENGYFLLDAGMDLPVEMDTFHAGSLLDSEIFDWLAAITYLQF